MSSGSFNVIGDVVFYQPIHNESYYFMSSGRHIGYLTEEILTGIDPYVNYANYDNNIDGKVDMIMICFRFANTLELDWKLWYPNATSGYQGIAGLTGIHNSFASGTTLTLDGKTISASQIGSGIFCNGITSLDDLHVVVHEFGHYLFSGSGIGNSVNHLLGTYRFGLMETNGGGSVMNGLERETLGWVTPHVVNSNLTNEVVSDAVSTGDVYKILNPADNKYYYVEYHKGTSYYESTWKTYNGGPVYYPGNGILISKITGNSSHYLDIVSANGLWNWKKSGSSYEYPFEHDSPNSINGEDELDLYQKNTTSGVQSHPLYSGDQSELFNIEHNQIFSPWSNPSTYPDNSHVAVELVQKDQSNNYVVNFYVSNPQNAAPSKPQILKIAKGIYNSYLHKYLIRLNWNANIEPDLSLYEIWSKVGNGNWVSSGTSTTNSFDDINYFWGGTLNLSYKIRAKDTQNKYSVYSDEANGSGSYAPKVKDVDEEEMQKPSEYLLFNNYPNPFNPTTEIKYSLKEDSFVVLKVFDMLGREVALLKNEHQPAGNYVIHFNANNLSSGIYFYTIDAGDFHQVKKMILLR